MAEQEKTPEEQAEESGYGGTVQGDLDQAPGQELPLARQPGQAGAEETEEAKQPGEAAPPEPPPAA
ncbi:MAG TPA: hypothetical protein VNJ53_02380 [Gaiellaceae bacterium]|nr:hypothetical protein [Gaiellaceae bacterium]